MTSSRNSISHTPLVDYSSLIGSIREGIKLSSTNTTEKLSRKYKKISLEKDGETVSLTKEESSNGDFVIKNANLYYIELFDGRYFYLTSEEGAKISKGVSETIDSESLGVIFSFNERKSEVSIPSDWLRKIRRFIAFSTSTSPSATINLLASSGVEMIMAGADKAILYGYTVDGVLILRRDEYEDDSVESSFSLPLYSIAKSKGYLYEED